MSTRTKELMDKYGVSWFKFDENVSSQLVDSKGNNVGSVTGTTVITGVNGNARSFNGVSDFIKLTGALIPTGAKSIRFKVRATPPSVAGYLLINVNSFATQQGFGVMIDTDGKMVLVGSQATSAYRYFLSTPKSICDNQWHDILFTWDGTTNTNTVKLYVDDMVNPAATTTAASQETVAYHNGGAAIGRIGSTGTTGYLRFDIDELEIYNALIDPFVRKILLSFGDKNYRLERVISRENAVPVMTSASSNEVEIKASAYNASDFPWYAFDGQVSATVRPFWFTNSTPPAEGHWLQVKFNKPKIITGISLASLLITGTSYSIKEFELYGSNDGVAYEKIYANTQLNVETRIYYDFESSKAYSYYRLNILSSYNTISTVGVNEMEIFEKKNQTMYVLDSGSEKEFIQYGMKDDISINEMIGKIKDIRKTNQTLGSGKSFEHIVDMSKRRVDKITQG